MIVNTWDKDERVEDTRTYKKIQWSKYKNYIRKVVNSIVLNNTEKTRLSTDI